MQRLLDAGAPGVHLYTLNLENTAVAILEGLGLVSAEREAEGEPVPEPEEVAVADAEGDAEGTPVGCGDALSAVAATRSHISFISTGEHMHEFEHFETAKFVGRLLGVGDWGGFIDKVI